jgi:hypothetical protein
VLRCRYTRGEGRPWRYGWYGRILSDYLDTSGLTKDEKDNKSTILALSLTAFITLPIRIASCYPSYYVLIVNKHTALK